MRFTERVVVKGKLGLHLRAAAKLSTISARFQSRITVRNERRQADARSILNLLALAAVEGSILEFTVDGNDAGEALAALRAFMEEDAAPVSLIK